MAISLRLVTITSPQSAVHDLLRRSLNLGSSVERSASEGKPDESNPWGIGVTSADSRLFPGLFVAGTDTDAGKTVVAAMIVRTLVVEGVRVGPCKPVASGVVAGQPGDAESLWIAAGRPRDLAAVCPQSFGPPLAPPHAARVEEREVDEGLLRKGVLGWMATSDLIVVEGAGGLFSPISKRLLNADLAADLGWPLVVVDCGRLGCVGRVLATCIAAEARGLDVAAVVLSQVEADRADSAHSPTSPGQIARDGAAEIRRHLPRLAVTILPHAATVTDPPLPWRSLAERRLSRT